MKAKRWLAPVGRFFGFLFLALCLSFVLFHVLSQPFQVFGSSMSPTLTDGDYLLVDRIWFRGGEIRRGDLVIFRLEGDDRFYVKRVVGVGGDRVELLSGGTVRINGAAAPFALSPEKEPSWAEGSWTVPPHHLFCLGDNLPFSRDSRSFGPIPRGSVYGRVLLCYLPLTRSKWLLGP